MNSREIAEKLGQPNYQWRCFDPSTVKRVPTSKGVYVIRLAHGKTRQRLKGESDVIYIGSGNVKTRLSAHLNFRQDFKDKGWLIGLIARWCPLEFGSFAVASPAEAEQGLIIEFLKEHLELPPANRQRPRLSDFAKRDLLLQSLTPEQLGQLKNLVEKQRGPGARPKASDDTETPASHG